MKFISYSMKNVCYHNFQSIESIYTHYVKELFNSSIELDIEHKQQNRTKCIYEAFKCMISHILDCVKSKLKDVDLNACTITIYTTSHTGIMDDICYTNPTSSEDRVNSILTSFIKTSESTDRDPLDRISMKGLVISTLLPITINNPYQLDVSFVCRKIPFITITNEKNELIILHNSSCTDIASKALKAIKSNENAIADLFLKDDSSIAADQLQTEFAFYLNLSIDEIGAFRKIIRIDRTPNTADDIYLL